MNGKTEILDIDDIKKLVDTFYEHIRDDQLLSPIFNEKIQGNWPLHLEKMYKFWQTVLLEEHTYFGSPFVPHADLPVDTRHFSKWLQLFDKTVDEIFSGAKADEAKWRAAKMAEMFEAKIAHGRNNKFNI